MLPSSRPTNAQQHAQRAQFPSIIRTRSQQAHPLPPVDMYASPLKSAIRNHNHNHSTDQTTTDLKTDNLTLPDFNATHIDTHNETSHPPSHNKRSSSPSFARNDNAGKRARVLAESSQVNTLSRRYSDEFLGTPHLRNGLLFGAGSPLTPLPSTPHPNGSAPSRKSGIPSNVPGQGFISTTKPSIPSSSSAPQSSPSKSRIPVPSSSSVPRLSRQPSSLSVSILPAAGPSSPTKAPSRPSSVKSKTRAKGKVISVVRSRGPMTRLAAKRGVRRTSSSFTGQRAGASSAGSNLSIASSVSSNVIVAACSKPVTEKKSLITSSLLSSENALIQGGAGSRPTGNSSTRSPKKPTPLTALSTALQKLRAAPPTAPLPRPRTTTSLGHSRHSLIPSQTPHLPTLNSQDDVHVNTKASKNITESSSKLLRSKTLGHLTARANVGMGKMGLPLRRPTVTDGNGRSTPWTGPAFASKQTTLSTVPASPARSAAPTVAGDISPARDERGEILDVDTWVSSNGNNKGKETAQAETSYLEYSLPLADEPRATQPPPPDLVSPSRRASQASHLLTQSLTHPPVPNMRPPARSASASTLHLNPRTPVKTRGRTRPPPAPQAASDGGAAAKPDDDPMGGKRSNARMPGSLDVLKNCIIFVDVRTEEGEDAAALFVDMLRGLGARILSKPGKSCTHLVYKAGLPSTITRYKLLPEPRPLPVSIGWVVECVEKRAHVDETRFLVNLNEIGVAGGIQRRRSMQPKQMRTLTLGQLDNGEPADISVRADSSFTSEEPSNSGLILATLSPPPRSPNDNLPPLERARQRSLRLPRQ